jgi:hypothetical protein
MMFSYWGGWHPSVLPFFQLNSFMHYFDRKYSGTC